MPSRLINNSSQPASRSELALFDVPVTEVGIQKSQYIEIGPANTLTNNGPYIFRIAQNPQLLQMSKNYLLLEFRILNAHNVPISEKIADPKDATRQIDATFTAPINLIAKTFIKQLKVSLNGHEVFDSGSDYAYRAYLETELMHSWESKHTHLKVAGYEEDKTPIDDVNNTGFLQRAQYYRKGNYVQLLAPLHCDFFMQDKLMVPNIEMCITIYRNSDQFCLLNYEEGGNYHIDIQAMKFFVKAVDVLSSVSLGLEKALLRTSAKYPIKRVQVHTCHISESRRSMPENSMFQGEIPCRIIIGCVSTDAYYGNIKLTPFNFQNFDLTQIYITAGGIRYPSVALAPDYENNMFARAYFQFIDGLGYSGTDSGNLITPEKFKNGWCLYAFNLNPGEDDNGNWNLARQGTTTVHMEFAKPIPKGGAVAIVYAEYDSLLTIDGFRNCFLDYKA